MFAAAIALAQTPEAPAEEGSGAAADAALVARASRVVYTRELARNRAAETLDTDRGAVGRARRVGTPLVARASAVGPLATGWSWSLSVETRDEPMAWSLPNGSMMISWGLVRRLSLSDAELAAILAHAIAHQLTGDDARDAVAAYRRRHGGPDPDGNRAAAEMADILGKLIVSPHYDAAAEKAADALALELLARSGVDPAAAVSAWRKVAASGSTSAPGLLALHPTPPERIANLEAQVAQVMPLYEKALADAAAAPKPPQPEKKKSPPRRNPRQPQP
jgi:Zn-dependent protease with chaperone function